jgi:hypothetical protein
MDILIFNIKLFQILEKSQIFKKLQEVQVV